MKLTTCLAMVLVLFAISQASIELSDIAISKHNDSVYVDITTSKPCLYDHFMMKEAPERIVIDLEGVTNNWSRKRYDNLPFKSIEKVRSSQFQVSPELITRIVLDINRPIDYKVEKLAMGLRIIIPAAAGELSFIPWNARKQSVPIKTVVDKDIKKPAAVKKPEAKKPAVKKKKTSVKIESFPKRKVVKYTAGSSRDPFKPLIGNSGVLVSSGEVPAIENLSLVGVFDEENGLKALFEDTEGRGFILSPNDRVQNGYLVSIREDKVIFQVTEYGWTRTVALNLLLPGSK